MSGDVASRVAGAARQLLEGARDVAGDDLVALYLYGSTVMPDPPARPGDLDAHAIVTRAFDAAEVERVRRLQASIERSFRLELDVWWILLDHARRPDPPAHLIVPDERDTSWALHRAHLLAGRCVVLHGLEPSTILAPPTPGELAADLAAELRYAEEFRTEPRAWRYCVWGGCRILYSAETGRVAVSKREASAWALQELPAEWHAAVRAAGRAYDGSAEPGDEAILARTVGPFLDYCRDRFARTAAATRR